MERKFEQQETLRSCTWGTFCVETLRAWALHPAWRKAFFVWKTLQGVNKWSLEMETPLSAPG